MIQLYWMKSTTGTWLGLSNLDLTRITDYGVYVIWHGGNPSRVVYVGQGDIKSRLTAHRSDARIQAYAPHGLYVTWASARSPQVDGIERYLADTWNPLVGDAHPNVMPIAVNSPW